MGRLIDADVLIETLTKYKFGAISNDTEREYVKETVLNFVKEQPTAYDVEKVKLELKDTFERILAEILDETDSEYTIADFNIKPYSNRICENVKAGGINE